MFISSYYLLFLFILLDNQTIYNITVNDFSVDYNKTLLPVITINNYSISINIILIILLSLFVIIFSYYFFKHRDLPNKVFEVKSVENLSSETLNYLLTIMLGLLFINGDVGLLRLAIIFILLFLVYQAGGIYYLQPLLMLLGYKVYKCKVDDDKDVMIISKIMIKRERSSYSELFDDVFIKR